MPPLRFILSHLLLLLFVSGLAFTAPIAAPRVISQQPCKAQKNNLPCRTSDENPYTSPADVEAGGAIYRQQCSSCHGLRGEGGRGPRLDIGKFRHGQTDSEIHDIILMGIPDAGMPNYYSSSTQVWKLVSFVRSLSANTVKKDLPGDPQKGREIFIGKGNCLGCHIVGVEGGGLGPSLNDIGSIRSPNNLRVSVLDPNADVAVAYYTARVAKQDGTVVVGRRMNQDTYSIQLIDSQGNLMSFHTDELDELKVEVSSLMPPYQGAFSDVELDDLVAYLATLRVER